MSDAFRNLRNVTNNKPLPTTSYLERQRRINQSKADKEEAVEIARDNRRYRFDQSAGKVRRPR